MMFFSRLNSNFEIRVLRKNYFIFITRKKIKKMTQKKITTTWKLIPTLIYFFVFKIKKNNFQISILFFDNSLNCS